MEGTSSPPPLSSSVPLSGQAVNHSTPLGPTEGTVESDERCLDESMEDAGGIPGLSGEASGGGEGGKKRKVFPFHITSELKSLYRSGMIGVGVQYASLIETACIRTGLSKAQVKSWIKRTKYHQRKILKQDEERNNVYSAGTQDEDEHYNEIENDPVTLYTHNEPEGFHEQGGVVFVKNEESSVENIPLLRRHVLMPREAEVLDISSGSHSSSTLLDKRSVGVVRQLPIVHGIDGNRLEVQRVSDTLTSSDLVSYQGNSGQNPSSSTHIISPQSLVSGPQKNHPPALVLTPNGSGSTTGTSGRGLTNEQQLNQEASRVFRKIERNFKKLEELGYQGFAFGIHGDDIQLVNSSSISHCFTPPLLSYLRAVIVAANPPPLISHSTQATPISSTHHAVHVTAQPATSSTPSSRHYYMYEPARVQQRTEIYELNDGTTYHANQQHQQEDEDDEGLSVGGSEQITFSTTGAPVTNNGKIHVVLTCDPNLLYTTTGGHDDDISD